ncbi:MAG: serine/threonine dehydratase [Flammeovirgaceae bacterium]|nr:serine/threonine dehydratase [Flammeovirgaceae bacterium]|tara:strand:- start:6115 stop:7062 length:948 start_codon:yes stop_codon:yes gene_type:complete
MQIDIKKAAARISGQVLQTPLFFSKYLSALNKGQTYLKLENEQYTGSFKARGALNKILSLSASEKAKGLITASTGNHAQGFARALEIANVEGTIFLPTNAEASKVEALKAYKVKLEFHGSDALSTELYAMKFADKYGQIWISPYNDPEIIAGQGTLALEMTSQLDSIDAVLGCIGGGGMMSGVATWLNQVSPKTKIIGCLPENSPEMYLSVKKGEVVFKETPLPTLSDGSAGGLESDAITFDICRKLIHDYELTSESEIAQAIKYMVDKHHKIIEGAAAVALASFFKRTTELENQTVVIIICGGNITTQKLKSLM